MSEVQEFARKGSCVLPPDCHPEVGMLVDYWRSIHPPTGLPGRRHLDPTDIPNLLPNIRILDVVGRPPRFRTRLMGTGVVRSAGADHTNRWLDEVFPGFDRSSAALGLNTVVRTGALDWRRGNPRLLAGKETMTIERIYLPLAQDGRTVDMILSYVLVGNSRGCAF